MKRSPHNPRGYRRGIDNQVEGLSTAHPLIGFQDRELDWKPQKGLRAPWQILPEVPDAGAERQSTGPSPLDVAKYAARQAVTLESHPEPLW
jgi:hypothetical protein